MAMAAEARSGTFPALDALQLHMIPEQHLLSATPSRRRPRSGAGHPQDSPAPAAATRNVRPKKTTTRTPKMDPAIWSRLPEALLDAVLLLLPAPSTARFQAVSPAWRTKLSAPAFAARTSAPALYSVAATDLRPAPDHATTMVDHRPLGLPRHAASLAALPARYRRWGAPGTQVRAQRGLLAVAVHAWAPHRLCMAVVNPANGTWRELPPLHWDTAGAVAGAWRGREVQAEVVMHASWGGFEDPSDVLGFDTGARRRALAVAAEAGAEPPFFEVVVAAVCCGAFLTDQPGSAALSTFSSSRHGGGGWSTVPHPCFPWPAGCDGLVRHIAVGSVVHVLHRAEHRAAVVCPRSATKLYSYALPGAADPAPAAGPSARLSRRGRRQARGVGRVQVAERGRGETVAVTLDGAPPSWSEKGSLTISVWALVHPGVTAGGRSQHSWRLSGTAPEWVLEGINAPLSAPSLAAPAPAPFQPVVGGGGYGSDGEDEMAVYGAGERAEERGSGGGGALDRERERDFCEVQVVGNVVVMAVDAVPDPSRAAVVAFHLVKGTWKVAVDCVPGADNGMVFRVLQLKPALDLTPPPPPPPPPAAT